MVAEVLVLLVVLVLAEVVVLRPSGSRHQALALDRRCKAEQNGARGGAGRREQARTAEGGDDNNCIHLVALISISSSTNVNSGSLARIHWPCLTGPSPGHAPVSCSPVRCPEKRLDSRWLAG